MLLCMKQDTPMSCLFHGAEHQSWSPLTISLARTLLAHGFFEQY